MEKELLFVGIQITNNHQLTTNNYIGESIMTELEQQIRESVAADIRQRPAVRVFPITIGDEKFWVKRRLGNGRNQLVKYSVEKEFYYEIARRSIAEMNCPDLVTDLVVLTPDYMVTRDGGSNVKDWLDKDIPEEEKEHILERAGEALASLHQCDIVHGRPALRDMTWDGKHLTFLDWENRMYSKDREEQKAIDLILILQGLCRENYEEEKARVKAILKGYISHGGEGTLEGARAFLQKHHVVGMLTKKLKPFHMVDVESVRKVYEYLLSGEDTF